MKKIIILFLCLNITLSPLYAYGIEDEFVNSTLDKSLEIKKSKYVPIEDSFATSNTNKNAARKNVVINETLPKVYEKKSYKKQVIFDDNYKEIKVKIKNYYTTKNKQEEGDWIEFYTLNDVNIKDKNYPKNSTVKARIETISLNKSYGVPSDVVIGNFMIDNNPLSGEISKIGANRTLWVKPIAEIGYFFFGIGVLLIPIRGGHAKIRPSETFTLYSIEQP